MADGRNLILAPPILRRSSPVSNMEGTSSLDPTTLSSAAWIDYLLAGDLGPLPDDLEPSSPFSVASGALFADDVDFMIDTRPLGVSLGEKTSGEQFHSACCVNPKLSCACLLHLCVSGDELDMHPPNPSRLISLRLPASRGLAARQRRRDGTGAATGRGSGICVAAVGVPPRRPSRLDGHGASTSSQPSSVLDDGIGGPLRGWPLTSDDATVTASRAAGEGKPRNAIGDKSSSGVRSGLTSQLLLLQEGRNSAHCGCGSIAGCGLHRGSLGSGSSSSMIGFDAGTPQEAAVLLLPQGISPISTDLPKDQDQDWGATLSSPSLPPRHYHHHEVPNMTMDLDPDLLRSATAPPLLHRRRSMSQNALPLVRIIATDPAAAAAAGPATAATAVGMIGRVAAMAMLEKGGRRAQGLGPAGRPRPSFSLPFLPEVSSLAANGRLQNCCDDGILILTAADEDGE